jgi:hypothetical protein
MDRKVIRIGLNFGGWFGGAEYTVDRTFLLTFALKDG